VPRPLDAEADRAETGVGSGGMEARRVLYCAFVHSLRICFLIAACATAGCAATPRPAAYATGVAASADDAYVTSLPLVDVAPEDATFARGEIAAGRALFVVMTEAGRPRFVRGCAVAAAYGFDERGELVDVAGALQEQVQRETQSGLGSNATNLTIDVQRAGVYRLAALARNDVPPDAACAPATHVVQAVETGAFRVAYGRYDQVDTSVRDRHVARAGDPIAITIVAVDPADAPGPRTIAHAAEHRHLEARYPGAWTLDTNRAAPLCALPCDAWLLPGGWAYARDARSGRELVLPASGSGESVVVTTGKEQKDPVVAWFAIGGGTLAALGAGYLSYAFWSGQLDASSNPSGPGSSAALSGAARDALGEVVVLGVLMPVLAVAGAVSAGWGVRELVRTPGEAPVTQVEQSAAAAGHPSVRVGVGGVSGDF
jgi:hypothetical protein